MKTFIIAALSTVLMTVGAKAAEKPPVVLVHGAFEDASVWKGVQAGLEKSGYKTVAVNLPGRSSNPLNPGETSLKVYRDAVLKAIEPLPSPVVLVGHSFGGIVISEVGEAAPAKIKTLVYLAAFLPKDGESLVSLANQDKGSEAGPKIQFLKDKGVASLPRDIRGSVFVNDGNKQQKQIVTDAIVDEPLPPLAEPVHLSQAFAGVDKVYIRTKQDKVITPAAQSAMLATTKVRATYEIDSGHAAFVTQGPELVAAIIKAAK